MSTGNDPTIGVLRHDTPAGPVETLHAGSTGTAVVCLHGFPDTPHTFGRQIQVLADAGYQALAPSLRGYTPGLPAAPDNCHPLSAARDVLGLLDRLGIGRAHLLGHDWGAMLGYLLAALAPERFASLTTSAVPHPLGWLRSMSGHPQQLLSSWYMLFFQLPDLPERVVASRGFLRWLWKRWSPGLEPPVAVFDALLARFQEPAIVRAALAYYRDSVRGSADLRMETETLLRAPIEVPTLAMFGAQDGCVRAPLFEAAMLGGDFREVRMHCLEQSGHFMHLEQPEAFEQRLLDWLRTHPAVSGV